MSGWQFLDAHTTGCGFLAFAGLVFVTVMSDLWLAHCRVMNAARVSEAREWREAEEREAAEARAREEQE